MKSIKCFLLTLLIILLPINIFASDDISHETSVEDLTIYDCTYAFFINGQNTIFEKPLLINNRTYLKLSDFLKVIPENDKFEFIVNNRFYKLNDKVMYCQDNIYEVDQNTYIPLTVISECYKSKIMWAEPVYSIYIEISNEKIQTRTLDELIPEYKIEANVLKGTTLYSSINGKAIRTLGAGKVEVVRDRAYKWYYIKTKEYEGWIKSSGLKISKGPEIIEDTLSSSDLEYLANNYFSFKSDTVYAVWVDQIRQNIYIFKNINSLWSLEKTFKCATGKNISPTIKGDFKINQNRGIWMPAGHNIYVKNYVGFYENYFFHSIKITRTGKVVDGTLGGTASMGCIRLAVEDIEWFYNNIPVGTKVLVR